MAKKLWTILMFFHQLPQTLLGLFLTFYYKGEIVQWKINGLIVTVIFTKKISGSVSLGQLVFVNENAGMNTVHHEFGHCIQSQYLGWLYLIVIGLPSIIWAFIHTYCKWFQKWSYYSFYTEKWANKLYHKKAEVLWMR